MRILRKNYWREDRVRISALVGDDAVCQKELAAKRLYVHMGRGNDRLDLAALDIDELTQVNGDDTLGEENNSLNGPTVRTFEKSDDSSVTK